MRAHTWRARSTFTGILGGLLLLALAVIPSLASPHRPHQTARRLSFQATGTLIVIAFHDLNQNQVQDSGEPGLSGVGVQVFLITDGVSGPVASGSTDSTGQITFSNLSPAQYRVEISPLTSYAAIAGETRLVTVLGGLETNVAFPLVEIQTPTPGPSPTQGATPTVAPTFTPTPTPPPTDTHRPRIPRHPRTLRT
ncbi:MAG: SdrD B-like domain-containing protein [Ardenticatenia bacterium]|nr:SdrD B-like domain-containing protein [Ardenticatenia bacterium]